MLRFFGVSISVLILTSTCCAQDVIIDWALPSHGLERAPSRLEPPVTLKVVVKNVNDYLYSYRGEITVDPTPESIGPPRVLAHRAGKPSAKHPTPASRWLTRKVVLPKVSRLTSLWRQLARSLLSPWKNHALHGTN